MINFILGISLTLNILSFIFIFLLVRYFTNKDKVTDKLNKTLNSIVDEEAFNFMFRK